jgi:hypothetical protein
VFEEVRMEGEMKGEVEVGEEAEEMAEILVLVALCELQFLGTR